MSIPHKLSLVIQRSHSLQEILDSAVKIVAEEMGTDSCSIYLLDPGGKFLRLMASQGLDQAALGKVVLRLGEGLTGILVKEMRSLAVRDASSHPGFRYFPETREERFKSYLGVPMAMRNRPVGAVVVQTAEERSYQQAEIETLAMIAAQLVGVVENARLIEALDRGEEESRFLEEVRRWHAPEKGRRKRERIDLVLEGSPASGGVAMGEAIFRGSYDLRGEDASRPFAGKEAETERFHQALEATRRDILEIQRAAEREADEEHALIFSSHLLLLNDPVLAARIEQTIGAEKDAENAVYHALEEFERRLARVQDPYIRERVEDIRDLRSRILGHLLRPGSKGPQLHDRVVVTPGLPPSLVVELKAEGAKGLITEVGGTTSHGALLARSMGIPAVTGVQDVANAIRNGDILIVDGDEGRVIVNPSEDTQERYEARSQSLAKLRSEYLKFRDRPAESADGLRVEIDANIAVATDLATAKENGAEGVGLYRTEFPFIVREHFPTREEQVRIYSRAFEFFPDGNINFRLLDLGGDKFLPSGRLATPRNPFHGYRSIRVLLDYPQVLRDQVQAFALAAGDRRLNILIPMVSTVDEVRRVRKLIVEALSELPVASAKLLPRLGIMVELPATVEIARSLAKEADFLSIGTNDLIQYALAIDRENSRIASRTDPFHPAILKMIERTILAAHAESKPVGVCGEMASHRLLSGALVALGVDSLSVAPGAILQLKQRLASMEVRRLAAEFGELLELGEAPRVEERLVSILGDD